MLSSAFLPMLWSIPNMFQWRGLFRHLCWRKIVDCPLSAFFAEDLRWLWCRSDAAALSHACKSRDRSPSRTCSRRCSSSKSWAVCPSGSRCSSRERTCRSLSRLLRRCWDFALFHCEKLKAFSLISFDFVDLFTFNSPVAIWFLYFIVAIGVFLIISHSCTNNTDSLYNV